MGFYTGYVSGGSYQLEEKLRIDELGRVGIGTTSPSANGLVTIAETTNARLYLTDSTIGNTYGAQLRGYGVGGAGGYAELGVVDANTYSKAITIAEQASTIVFSRGATERARIDSSGRLLVGTSTARDNFFNATGTAATLQIEGTTQGTSSFSVTRNSANASAPGFYFAKSRNASVGGNTVVQSGDECGLISFQGNDGTEFVEAASIRAVVDGTPGADDMPGRLVFSTTADGASSPTERLRIDSKGAITHTAGGAVLAADLIASFVGGGIGLGVKIYEGTNTGAPNAANAVVKIGNMATAGRSINAGGTINASGADYAEYMTKAGDFEIAKGDVCGVTANGELTNDFGASISFAVKSTNPSYVGGDTWGIGFDDDPEQLEVERQKVDRIAFAGQVPVNVINAKPGQYIVPIATENGGITGIAKDEADLTLAEYMRAVGKVIAIEDDGRARIIVKVA
jgi:hypothetical protein